MNMGTSLTHSLVITAILTLTFQLRASASLLDNIIFTQYDDVASQSCGEDGLPIYAPFEDDSGYFENHFQSLKAKVKEVGKELRELNIKRKSLAPDPTVINNAYKELVNADDRVTKGYILFGENSDIVFCYRDGILTECSDIEQLMFETTTGTSWTYAYGCNGWEATLQHQDLKFVAGSLTKVVFSIKVDISEIEINQCANSTDPEFKGTAYCTPSIAQCIHVKGQGFKAGSYLCQCLHCTECSNVTGLELSSPDVNASVTLQSRCTPPKPATESPGVDTGVGGVLGSLTLRPQFARIEVYILLAIQGLCVAMALSFTVVVLAYKSSQVMRSSKWGLLELLLLGAILKYLLLLWLALEPSDLTCVIYQWFAELSFVCMYGAIIIKIHKRYIEFQGRHKQVKNVDLALYWLVCALITIVYLASWTVLVWSYLSLHNVGLTASLPLSHWVTESTVNMVGDSVIQEAPTQLVCSLTGWNFVTQAAELILTLYGLYMLIKLRREKSLFSENKWFCIVLVIELITSLIYYIIGGVIVIESYWNLLMTFMYHQLTVTLALLLIFCPKFYHVKKDSKMPTQDSHNEVNELNIQVTSHNDVELELKKAQDEIYLLKGRIAQYESSEPAPLPDEQRNVEPKVISPRAKSRPVTDVKDGSSAQLVTDKPRNVEPKVISPRAKSRPVTDVKDGSSAQPVPDKPRNVEPKVMSPRAKSRPNWNSKDISSEQEAVPLTRSPVDTNPEPKVLTSPRRKTSPRHTAM